jgi:hypothetical protein
MLGRHELPGVPTLRLTRCGLRGPALGFLPLGSLPQCLSLRGRPEQLAPDAIDVGSAWGRRHGHDLPSRCGEPLVVEGGQGALERSHVSDLLRPFRRTSLRL